MSKICLSFIFNHQYEKNIPKLREIYGDRFSTIRYLSPFSTYNDDQEVIPVYETSINFQGYIAQSLRFLPNDCDYYIFCADDLLLNPDFNENKTVYVSFAEEGKNDTRGAVVIKATLDLTEEGGALTNLEYIWRQFGEPIVEDNCLRPGHSGIPLGTSRRENHG